MRSYVEALACTTDNPEGRPIAVAAVPTAN
jgi:hypothetical protein